MASSSPSQPEALPQAADGGEGGLPTKFSLFADIKVMTMSFVMGPTVTGWPREVFSSTHPGSSPVPCHYWPMEEDLLGCSPGEA